MTETLATSGAVKYKAGANVNSTISGDSAAITQFINQAEGDLGVASRKDWVATYAGLNTSVKKILEEAVSNLAAIYLINYDMSGYTTRGEAESMITVLRDSYLRITQFLRDQKSQTFINGA